MSLRFVLDGAVIEIADADPTAADPTAPDPTASVLDHLRYRMARTGTKEGCAEGDCGACTVLVGTLNAGGDGVDWRAVNACILFLPMVHGKALMTVESLGTPATLGPLQACMAANGSSQCGFCTPGFVMSLYGRSIGARGADLPVADVLAGNLCRCTGYGPILAAGAAAAPLARDDSAVVAQLRLLRDTDTVTGGPEGRTWFKPRTADALAALLAAHPDARLVAGATDVGLWVTKKLQTPAKLIFLGDIAELGLIVEAPEGVTLGAAVRYADAHGALARLHPDLGELVRRIGGLQVRNAGTVCGNIANGSPIGDGPPALIALGAQVTLRSVGGRRTIPLEEYFVDYGQQDLRPGEFVEQVFVPRPAAGDIVHVSKLSRRFDSDISAVCGAVHLRVVDGVVAGARVAFGGMAATPRRAPACEAALTGQPFAAPTIARAVDALARDYAPMSDVRGSAAYRQAAAGSVLWRLWHRAQGVAVSVFDAEVTHG